MSSLLHEHHNPSTLLTDFRSVTQGGCKSLDGTAWLKSVVSLCKGSSQGRYKAVPWQDQQGHAEDFGHLEAGEHGQLEGSRRPGYFQDIVCYGGRNLASCTRLHQFGAHLSSVVPSSFPPVITCRAHDYDCALICSETQAFRCLCDVLVCMHTFQRSCACMQWVILDKEGHLQCN